MLELRNIRPDDRELRKEAEAFLEANPDRGVRPRPAEQMARSLATGLGLAVLGEAGMCALSLVHSYPDPTDPLLYQEIGTMRVTANGLGLQRFLAQFHLVQAWLEADEAELPYVFAVVEPGSISARNLLEGVGMVPTTPPARPAPPARGGRNALHP